MVISMIQKQLLDDVGAMVVDGDIVAFNEARLKQIKNLLAEYGIKEPFSMGSSLNSASQRLMIINNSSGGARLGSDGRPRSKSWPESLQRPLSPQFREEPKQRVDAPRRPYGTSIRRRLQT